MNALAPALDSAEFLLLWEAMSALRQAADAHDAAPGVHSGIEPDADGLVRAPEHAATL